MSDITLAFERTGSGPPLIILHGLFGSSANWRSIAQCLTKSYAVDRVDLRNHGVSPWHDTMDYLDMADDVKQFIEQHQLEDPILLGHSMGGKVAMVLAVRYPDLVKSLVVVDIAPVATDNRHTSVVRALRKLNLAAVKSRRDAEVVLSYDVPDAGLRQFLLQNLIRRETGYAWRINLRALAENMPMLADFPVLPGCYSGPTLFVRGGDSNYVEIKHEPVIQKMFPTSVIRTIAGAGHWLHAEKPREFVHELERFLSSVDED